MSEPQIVLPTKKKRSAPEHNLQRDIVNMIEHKRPEWVVFAVPNGERRSAATLGKLKAQGVRAGAPDLIIITNNKIMMWEIKSGNGAASKNQKHMHDKINKLGQQVKIIRTLKQAIEEIANQ